MLEGGHVLALWHPTEVLIIVGAALGAFMTSNPPKVSKAAFTGAIGFVKGPRYKREDYIQLLKCLYDILVKIRKEGLMAIESSLEAPDGGVLFKNYPKIFGVTINDDGAELSSRMNDHPRIYIFIRRQPIQR